MMSPRVLHVQTDTGLVGGIANYIGSLCGEDSGFDVYVTVAGLDDAYLSADRLYPGAHLLPIESSYSARSFRAYVSSLVRLIQLNEIQIIHAHALRSALAATLAARQAGIPIVYTNHGLRFTQKSHRVTAAVFEWLEKFVCRSVSDVVCIRPYDAQILLSKRWVLPNRLHTIRTRIDASTPKLVSSDDKAPLLIGVGSLIDVKRPDVFLSWLYEIKKLSIPFRAAWLGDGPLMTSLKNKASSMGIAVEWLGHVQKHDLLCYLNEASVLLLTSKFEVLPLSVLEAYSQGTPVVGTFFPGVHDFLIDEKTGLIVSSSDPKNAAAAIAKLIINPKKINDLSIGARSFFYREHSGVAEMRAIYGKIYQRCLVGE